VKQLCVSESHLQKFLRGEAALCSGALNGEGAVIGDDVVIGDESVIGDDTVIGDEAVIGDDAVIGDEAAIGDEKYFVLDRLENQVCGVRKCSVELIVVTNNSRKYCG